MKKKLLGILLNHYVISIFVSVIITFSILNLSANIFSKYILELEDEEYFGINYRNYFIDLDGNNLSERIYCRTSIGQNASFIIYDDNGNLIDQWNIKENTASSLNPYGFYDTDNNGFKEIYFITQKADSSFLNILEPFSKKGLNKEIRKVFIDTIHKFSNKFNFSAHGFKYGKCESEGVKEVYFTLYTGFGGYPRNIYKYNYRNNQISKSSHLTNVSFITEIADINNDGYDEIFFNNTSYGNKLDSVYTSKSDNSLWLNVIDTELNFLFKPIEFKVPFSELKTFHFKYKNNSRIASLLNSAQKENTKSKLFVFTNKGEQIRELDLPFGFHNFFLNSKKNGFVLYNSQDGSIKILDFILQEKSSTLIDSNSELKTIDLNEDGINEWISISKSSNKFSIYPSDFSEKQTFEIPNKEYNFLSFGVKKSLKGNQLYVQKGRFLYLFSYKKNIYYYLKFVVFLTSFLVVLGFVLLILKGQKIKLEKKRAIENKIIELQLKTIKNQVDPHFVFNAINTISGLMLTDKKLEADEFICNFSELMRSTLQKSDKIFCTLNEEIEYVKKYMELQQVRFNHQFKYEIKISNSVQLNEKVPKHILYTYIENAIKHGLNTKRNLLIKIDISKSKNKLILIIEDNGGGFDTSKNTRTNSTGSGLSIMEKIYNLYAKLYKKKITHKIKEIKDAENKVVGVKVLVFISQ